MDFTLNEKQKMLQSMVRDFTRKDVEPRWQEMEKSRRIPDDLLQAAGLARALRHDRARGIQRQRRRRFRPSFSHRATGLFRHPGLVAGRF